MPMVKRGVGDFKKFRLMISGRAFCGKTYSIKTFVEDGQSLAVIVCPGESGNRSLPDDGDNLVNYIYEELPGVDPHSVEWSEDALSTFQSTYKEVVKNKPDKLFIDGVHWLYAHMFNKITDGEFLTGMDMNVNPMTGRNDPYRSARFYTQAHTVFGQYLASFYACAVPFVCVTVWEDWQSGRTEGDKPGTIDSVRYLHPALPGAMATNVAGRFDARISARVEKRCLHKGCEESRQSREHFVWQFLPKNDVQGVGIKGLTPTEGMMKTPWIHQSATALFNLLKRV